MDIVKNTEMEIIRSFHQYAEMMEDARRISRLYNFYIKIGPYQIRTAGMFADVTFFEKRKDFFIFSRWDKILEFKDDPYGEPSHPVVHNPNWAKVWFLVGRYADVLHSRQYLPNLGKEERGLSSGSLLQHVRSLGSFHL